MSFDEFNQTYRPQLAQEIQALLNAKKADKNLPFYADSLEKISTLATAGKLWRGLFLMLAQQGLAADQSMAMGTVNAAVAVELVQTALVVHDDIIDNDYTRRGMPTIFAQYITDNNVEYGKNLGICTGDIAIFLAYEALARATTDSTKLSRLISIFSRELHLVGVGEMMDVQMATLNTEPSIDEIIDMYRYKTARYTFSMPLMMGAVLAGASEEHIATLDTFGENAGILFQIRDDGLGLTGDEKTTGKPVGADIKENKKTVHRNLLYSQASAAEITRLNTCFGNKNLTPDDHLFVQEVLTTHGIDAKITALETQYADNATQALTSLPAGLKTALEEILVMIRTRTK